MADEKQDDMSMDEILSSIKGILSEKSDPETTAEILNHNQIAEPEVDNNDVLDFGSNNILLSDLPFGAEDDAVLDLTPEMRADSDHDSLNLDSDPFDGEDLMDLSKELADIPTEFISPIAESAADSEAPEAELITDSDPLEITSDLESDPIYVPEEAIMPPMYEESPDSLPDFSIHQELIEEPAENLVAPSALDDSEEAISHSAWQEAESNQDGDATDVSADIINNFAKIFAQSKNPEVAATPVAPQVAPSLRNFSLGNLDQTLNDLVKDVIRDIISDLVKDSLSNKADLDIIANQEIVRQVKGWLDTNLPGLVEAIVKKEIAQVMDKVNKN